jgi:hypothetical protein
MTLAPSQLRVADIIVSTTSAAVSGAIRTGTGSSVSHAMVYVGGQFIVEAIGQGVVKRTLQQAISDASLAIALRRRNLTAAQRVVVKRHAESYARRGLPYDEIGAMGSGAVSGRGRLIAGAGCLLSLAACGSGAAAVLRNASPDRADDAFFCSELVARVFEIARAPLVDGRPTYTTPRQVRMSTHLLYLGKLKDT